MLSNIDSPPYPVTPLNNFICLAFFFFLNFQPVNLDPCLSILIMYIIIIIIIYSYIKRRIKSDKAKLSRWAPLLNQLFFIRKHYWRIKLPSLKNRSQADRSKHHIILEKGIFLRRNLSLHYTSCVWHMFPLVIL